MTCITIARPQIMCRGFGRDERIREPSPAASTIAETAMRTFYRNLSSGERTRTPINGTKNRCPTIERPRTDRVRLSARTFPALLRLVSQPRDR